MVIYMKGGIMEKNYADFALLFKARADEVSIDQIIEKVCQELL